MPSPSKPPADAIAQWQGLCRIVILCSPDTMHAADAGKGSLVTLNIALLDRGSLDASLRAFSFPHAYQEYEFTAADQIVERLKDADIAIVNKVPLRANTLRQLPRLKLIAVAATGTDTIDKVARHSRAS